MFEPIKEESRKRKRKTEEPIKEPDYQKIIDLLTVRKGKLKGKKKTLYKSIYRGELTEEA